MRRAAASATGCGAHPSGHTMAPTWRTWRFVSSLLSHGFVCIADLWAPKRACYGADLADLEVGSGLALDVGRQHKLVQRPSRGSAAVEGLQVRGLMSRGLRTEPAAAAGRLAHPLLLTSMKC